MRQRIIWKLIKCRTKTGLLLELAQCLRGADELDRVHVRSLLDQPGETFGLTLRQVLFEKDRKIERVIPASADRTGVLDDQVDGGGQSECHRDDEHDHEARKRMPHESTQ